MTKASTRIVGTQTEGDILIADLVSRKLYQRASEVASALDKMLDAARLLDEMDKFHD